MTRGDRVQAEPEGAAGMSIRQVFSFGTNMVKPRLLPSGDHLGAPGARVSLVIWVTAPSASM